MDNNLIDNLPLISVVLPVYNAESYVSDSIQSILNQTYKNIELIIINDGSTDTSEQLILEFNDERIKYIKNSKNLKLIDTLNLGLKLANGKYIARIDADDISLNDRFEKQVSFLEQNPTYGIVGSFAECFGETNGKLKYVEDDEDIRFSMLTYNPFIHSSIMFRSSIMKEQKLQFNHDQLHVEDYDFWINFMDFTKGKILPELLIKYRVHGNQISAIHFELQKINTLRLQKKYFNRMVCGLPFVNELCDIFYSSEINTDLITLFFNNHRVIKNKLNSSIQTRIYKRIESKIREAFLLKNKINVREFLFIIKFGYFFTLKQKIAFFYKLF